MEKKCSRIFNSLCIVVMGMLSWFAWGKTWRNTIDYADEFVYMQRDSFLGNICFLVVILGILFGVAEGLKRFENIPRNLPLGLVCIVALCFSFYWLWGCPVMPKADQGYLCWYASDINAGDYTQLQAGNYLAVYPQQLGLLTVLRFIFKVFGDNKYIVFQCFNACMVPVLIFGGAQIIRILSENNNRVEWIYLMLMVTCLPMYMYVPFVYGEISSTAMVILGTWAVLSCLHKFRWWKVVTIGLLLGGAVQLRKNTTIFLVAVGIVLVIKLFVKFDKNILWIGLGMLIGVMGFQIAVTGSYQKYVEGETQGIPAGLFVVMGLHDDYGKPGWWNNYNLETFEACGYDVDAANAKAMEDLKGYVLLFSGDPGYMVDFFRRKIETQWNVPLYQAVPLSGQMKGLMSPLVEHIYIRDDVGERIESCQEALHLLVYVSVFLFLILYHKKWSSVEKYMLLIAVFGGFLFSLIWEAKPRYVFPYYLMMIPYAAFGVEAILQKIKGVVSGITVKHNRYPRKAD